VAGEQCTGMTANEGCYHYIGKAGSNYNEAATEFTYVGAGSTSNSWGVGLYGTAYFLNVNGAGNVYTSLTATLGCTHGSNATCGVATLSSGTVTVSTTAIAALAAAGAAGDAVELHLQSCSSCGALSVGTVTAGTSFVINSTNGSDASLVFWKINVIQ
jgi:hypothetical protein